MNRHFLDYTNPNIMETPKLSSEEPKSSTEEERPTSTWGITIIEEMIPQQEPRVEAMYNLMKKPSKSHRILMRMVLGEMFGTFVLVFSTCGIVAFGKGGGGLLEYAIGGGLAVSIVVFSVGRFSGAHVNPSITIALAAIDMFPWTRVPIYVAAQLVSAIVASWMGKLVYDMPMDLAVTRPLNGRNKAFFAEFFATTFIMFVVSSIATAPCMHHVCFMGIGSTVVLAILIAGPVSGGSMNPARSLGPAIISWNFEDSWIYILAPTAGAIVGALLFNLVHIKEEQTSSDSSSDNASQQDTSLHY